MKKKFVALLMSAAMVSGSLALPVYAAEEETVIEFADDEEDTVDVEEEPEESEEQEDTGVSEIPEDTWEDFSDQPVTEDFSSESEAVGTSTTLGGNINWGSSNATLPTDVTTVKTGRMFLGIKGSYITDMQNALNRINAIRKEACDEGIKDPRNESRNLASSDYVPIKWSSDLEYIARIRAAEASVYRQHIRLNGYDAFAIYSPNGVRSWGEVLAWNTSRTFLQGIEQWYREKKDWVGNTGKVTGHYTQMIDPDNIYVGLATFINPNVGYSTTTAGEFTSQRNLDYSQGTSGAVLDESAGPAIDNCIQTVEVKTDKITASMPDFNSLAAPNNVQAEFNLTVYNCKMETLGAAKWTSSDVKTATVDNTGKVTGVHEGSADITAACGDFFATKTIQVTGHPNTELKNAKEATCSKEGYTGDKICKDCGKTIEAGKAIPKKEHSWDAGKVTKAATCTETGVKTYVCQSCSITRTEDIPALGHKIVTDAAVAATCETDGKTEGSHCSVCGTVLTAQKTVKATGHDWDEGKITKSATCEEKGVKTYTCRICEKTRTEDVSALGHQAVTDAAVAATCETDGKTEGSHCFVCGKVLVKQETVKATGHKPVTDAAVPAICENDGKTEGSHCSVCGKVLTAQKTIPALGHTWDAGKITKEAACETKGAKTYTCETCKKTRTEEIPALGHKFGAWVTTSQADVLSPAKQTRICTVCGKKEQRNYGSRLRGTMTVNVSSIPLKTRQKTSVLKVTGLARGDSITSWKSSNTKVVKVTGRANGTCRITAGNKTGKAKITITLRSGLQKTVNVSVQKSTVKTKKISGVARTLRLNRKQKATLKPVRSPLTSTEKITYKSSNSKVASVNSKGQITAKKKGTTIITVKSGKKTVKCKVTVK